MAGIRRAVLACIVAVTSVVSGGISPLEAAQPSCRATGEEYALACDLIDGAARGALQQTEDVDAYRLVVLDFRSAVRIELVEAPDSLRARLLDWQRRVVAEATGPAGNGSEVRLDDPGVYYLLVDAPRLAPSTAEESYRVQVTTTYADVTPQAVLLPKRTDLVSAEDPSQPFGATSVSNGRYRLSTLRGGTPEVGLGAARELPLSGEATRDDFTFVADARFEQPVSDAALTLRFRYTLEAGGGGGYILAVHPFLGQFRLSTFEEGNRETIVPWTAHPAARSGTEPMRIIVRAVGPTIAVHLNGEEVLEVEDDRYTNGVIVVGTVTWSEAVNVTFDNVLVTTPAV